MTRGSLFVTGAQRSGTTLLEKLLGMQSAISMLSQPFPLLFAEVKRQFLGGNEAYPLGHCFLESRYEPHAFARFLGDWRTTPAKLEALFARMESYSGQYTRFTKEQRRSAVAGITAEHDFGDVVRILNQSLASKDAAWYGSKETICEEYLPALADRGFHCAVIIRDPRAVIASLNSGRGREFGGELKPTLFNVRSWRKSVAIALAMDRMERFAHCRYEDLVADPRGTLTRVAPVDPEQIDVPEELRNLEGEVWRGNSSYGELRGVDTSPMARYRDVLPPQVAEFVESTCLPELQYLGYPTTLTREQAIRSIERFVEPYAITRTGMENDAMTPANAALEIERLERVLQAPDSSSLRWFLSQRAHGLLREAFRP